MDTLFTLIALGLLIYAIYKDKQKENKYKPDDLPRRVEEDDTENWIYDPKTKTFVEKSQSQKDDHHKDNVHNSQNNGEYHYAYKRASNTESEYRHTYKRESEEKPKTEYQYQAKQEYKQQTQQPPKTENPQSGNYYAKPLLTARELQAYAKLKPMADIRGLIICPKVRLADLVHPYKNDPKFMSHFGRIKAKHVDFVICDQLMNVRGIIELDDRTHDRKDRQERDRLVDEILESVGYKIIHTREITPNILDIFTRQ